MTGCRCFSMNTAPPAGRASKQLSFVPRLQKHYLLTKIGSDASASRSNAAIEKTLMWPIRQTGNPPRVFHTLQLVNSGHVTFSLDMFASFKLSGHEAKHLRL